MKLTLRLSGRQHAELQQHLLQDENEAVALILCGRREREGAPILIGHKVFLVPVDSCLVRTPDYIHWHTETVLPAFEQAAREGLSVVKIHSHPGGFAEFSKTDDHSDRDLFPSLYGWVDVPHASAIMLPDGRIMGRHVDERGHFTVMDRVSVAGDDIHIWDAQDSDAPIPESADRHAKAFGAVTTRKLSTLRMAVIGCSGTGSIVVEQLGRLQIGELVPVDPERAELVNCNRIVGLTEDDVMEGRYKVHIMQRSVESMGLGTKVIPLPLDLHDEVSIKAVAECDVIFGCMDSASGRHILNKLACTYNIPYFDVGVKLTADGTGSIEHVCGSAHYLQPGGSSLLSRRLYTMQEVEAELMRKTNPEQYAERLKEKYIKGVAESRPAVVSINTIFAGLVVTEMLARLHPFRDDPNSKYASVCLSLNHGIMDTDVDGSPCPIANRYAGRGDMPRLLGLQGLEARTTK